VRNVNITQSRALRKNLQISINWGIIEKEVLTTAATKNNIQQQLTRLHFPKKYLKILALNKNPAKDNSYFLFIVCTLLLKKFIKIIFSINGNMK
jgi:hypothetical protein